LPGLDAKLTDLTWMRLVRGTTKIDFAAVGGRWVVVDKGNYPAAAGRLHQLLLGLADLTLVEPKTERPELFARLDLDDPSTGNSTEVTLQDRTGQTVAGLIVGKRRQDRLGGGNDSVYVRKPGINRAWLARGALDVSGETVEWLDRRILDIAISRIASVKLVGEDGVALVLSRPTSDDKFAVEGAPADTKFKGAAAMAGPAGVLTALDLTDVKPSADQPLPAAGITNAAFTIFDGLTIDIRLFSRDFADWVTISATGRDSVEPEAKAIDAKVAHWTYAIPADRAKLLRTRLADLVEPEKGS
jgi:Domain of unknown function (DUF4340)